MAEGRPRPTQREPYTEYVPISCSNPSESSLLIDSPGKVIILDSLNTLATNSSINLPSLLSSFITPTTSLVASYHLDISLTSTSLPTQINPYAPDPLTQLKYIATTIFTVHSLHHALAKQTALARSHGEPTFGLTTGVEGVLQGRGANGSEGFVMEMLHRRKSGKGVEESYFFPLSSKARVELAALNGQSREVVVLLEDHPLFKGAEKDGGEEDGGEATFEMGLTEKQRRDREGVVLPYTDAQQQGGGEGGRILYDMGEEDDFDEEEDEI